MDTGGIILFGLIAIAIVATLAWVWADAGKKGKPRWLIVPFCLITWPLGVALWSSMSNRSPGTPWPRWVRALGWFNAIALLLFVVGLPAKTAGQQLLYFAIVAAAAYPAYRWSVRKLQARRTSQSSPRAT